MERTAMDERADKHILDTLRSNQDAVQRLLDSIMQVGSLRASGQKTDDGGEPAPNIADHISGAQPFVAPVKAGSRVRMRVTLLSVEDRGQGRLLLKTQNIFEIEGEEKPALSAESLALVW